MNRLAHVILMLVQIHFVKRAQELTKRRDCDIHYVTRNSDYSNHTKKKVLFQVNAIRRDESNQAGLGARE